MIIVKILASLGYRISRLSAAANFKYATRTSANPNGDAALAESLLRFAKQVDLFYRDRTLPNALEIAGAWRDDLIERRKIQSNIYKLGDANAVAKFHENMFFNELVYGISNFGYLIDGRQLPPGSAADFQSDLENYLAMFPKQEFLLSTVPVSVWGGGGGAISLDLQMYGTLFRHNTLVT